MNRSKSKLFYLATFGISIVMLIIISLVQIQLNSIIREEKLTATGNIANAPPVVEFTTKALGCFRGLLADLLWLRAISLQDDGNYFEMVQLADWITDLQPKFSGATAFLAWNMAYNISVTCSSPVDRWRWVSRGIDLIRDRAIPYNPSDPLLYKELGWIYQHKVGNILDDANLYYKNQMAIKYMRVFGTANPDWAALAKAPKESSEFMDLPETIIKNAMQNSKYGNLGEIESYYFRNKELPRSFRDALKNPQLETKLIRYFYIKRALKESEFESIADVGKVFREEAKMPEKFAKAIDNKKVEKFLDDYFRANWLRNQYRLYPDVIEEINKKYGQLDWRLPEAHAIYWAFLGLKRTKDHKDISLERMITQALKDAFVGGRLLMVDKDDSARVILLPNFNVADALLKTFEEAYKTNKVRSFRSALENWIKDAIISFYTYGDYKKAEEYFEYLKKNYPAPRYVNVSFQQFVIREFTEDAKDATLQQALMLLGNILRNSLRLLAFGDYEGALGQEKVAKLVYAIYAKQYSDVKGRVGLPPYKQIKSTVTKNYLFYLNKTAPTLYENLKAAIEQEQLKSKAEKKEEQKREAERKARENFDSSS